MSFTIRVSRCAFGTATETNSTPPVPTFAGGAFCSAGMMPRMFAMPIWGLFLGSPQAARRPAEHRGRAGAPGHLVLPALDALEHLERAVRAGRELVHPLELIGDLEPLADELQRDARAARGGLPAAEQEQPRAIEPGQRLHRVASLAATSCDR